MLFLHFSISKHRDVDHANFPYKYIDLDIKGYSAASC
jgi:hypothetical protein